MVPDAGGDQYVTSLHVPGHPRQVTTAPDTSLSTQWAESHHTAPQHSFRAKTWPYKVHSVLSLRALLFA
jgi:hypothetical protein